LKDIKLPTGVEVVGEPDEVVALVEEAREEEAEETETTPDFDAIKVEKKGKKEEEAVEE